MYKEEGEREEYRMRQHERGRKVYDGRQHWLYRK